MSGRTQNWRRWCSSLVVGGLLIASLQEHVFAQITPDNTLPNNSVVTPDGNTLNITGGTQAGRNLFHSFSEFSVPNGGTASFNNAVDIQNIISRVTGGSRSNIDGIIRANGTANLFLINPNGIIFGQNAQLNIGGSFVGTTANAIGFGNQGFFSATNPESFSPLLTVNPTALLFNQIKTASIENNSNVKGLYVPDGKSLLLVGGDINMDGGLYAFGGRVELGGLAGAGTVGLNGDANNLSLSFPDSVERSDVFLSNNSLVYVAADNGGSIGVNARNLKMTGESSLVAGITPGLGSDKSKAGNIEVNAMGAINLDNRSLIANWVLPEAKGQAGDVKIKTNTLLVQDGARVNATTSGAGKGGNIIVDAQDVQLIGSPQLSGLFTNTYSTGDAGNITIKTNTLLVRDGAKVSAATFDEGKGGNIIVDAQDVQLIGSQQFTGLFTNALSTGDAGNLTIKTNTLLVRDGAIVSATTFSTGDAGNLTIKTNTLLVRDGAQVSAATSGAGKGGNIIVDAEDIQLIGESSYLGTSAESNSTGNAGDLTIKADTLLVRDGAAITVQSSGTGTAGIMTLNSPSIRLDNNALLSANTRSAKVDPNREQATININSENLIISRNSNIITNATGENVIGGNINIDTDFLIGFENSDISANSANSRGGNVQINASGIFGIQFRDVGSDKTSDITATGASPELNGTVELNTPDIDPNSGLLELPTVPVDTQVAQGCYSPGYAQNRFVITGRGGLPPNPKDILSPDLVQVDWVSLKPSTREGKSPPVRIEPTTATPKPIVEATGWVMNAKGELELTANAPSTPHGSWQNPVSCRASS